MSHPVFTPNGDGINDQVELNYSLLQLVKPVGVEVGIYDLAGRRVRTVLDAESASGAYAVAWDGATTSGRWSHRGSTSSWFRFTPHGKLSSAPAAWVWRIEKE